MTQEEAFLQDVCENPEDMTPRLIFADWLDEQSESSSPRAELIRVQCALHAAPKYSKQWRKLAGQAHKLLKTHKKNWTKPFRGFTIAERFFRGFVEDITLNAKRFIQNGSQLFEMCPLRRIKPARLGSDEVGYVPLSQFVEAEALQRVRELDLEGYRTREGTWEALAETPNVASLTWLNLERTHVDSDGLTVLLRSPHLRSLRLLGLRGFGSIFHAPTQEQVTEFADCFRAEARFKDLRELVLSARNLHDEALERLDRCPALSHLERLDLSDNPNLGTGVIALLSGSPRWSKLQWLSLQNSSDIGDQELRALADSSTLTNLEYLALGKHGYYGRVPANSRRDCTDEGFAYWASSKNVQHLRYLDLSYFPLTDSSAQAILD